MTFGPFIEHLDPAERRARCRALRAIALLVTRADSSLMPWPLPRLTTPLLMTPPS
jgi:hypothetical protein